MTAPYSAGPRPGIPGNIFSHTPLWAGVTFLGLSFTFAMTTTAGDDAGRPTPAPIPAADDVFAALRALVEDSVTPASDDAAAVRIRAGALFARLRALNRSANATIRAHKQATADARLKLDHTHLGLQNLLYEKRHLVREIEKCRQFA